MIPETLQTNGLAPSCNFQNLPHAQRKAATFCVLANLNSLRPSTDYIHIQLLNAYRDDRERDDYLFRGDEEEGAEEIEEEMEERGR